MATKKVSAKKTTLDKNVERIQKTAKNVNNEVAKTANKVVDNVVADGKELRALATKTAKEVNKKIDLRQNIKMIRKTTASVNRQVWKTAEDVMEDVTNTGKDVLKVAAGKTKKAITDFDMTEEMNSVKETVGKINAKALETADEMVDGAFANGEKWQKVAEKAMKGGMKLAGKQQEIVFDTLETVKGQLLKNAGRFRKIISNN